MIGRTIAHYRITREIGKGGMGVVYEGVDTKLDRKVALKFLGADQVLDPDAKTRFIHEAKAASSLDHPNICTIHGIEETDDGRLFIAMALYEGKTVQERLAEGPLSVPEALDIITQVLKGLARAHQLGIVHRDIKPANVLVRDDGLVKLLDFGIAKLVGQTQVTRTGSVLGSVQYMAPEQLQEAQVDRRADLWSVGVLLYKMLTGKLPFTGEHPPAMMYAILNQDPEPIEILCPDLPPAVADAVTRCLLKNPADRFQGVEELHLLLQPNATGVMNSHQTMLTEGKRLEADTGQLHPYPGLASFDEDDVEFFHGRESKVEAVWQKLRDSRMLAVTGPSGVGKTSFIQAGLMAKKPAGWGVIRTKPGNAPLLALREAMVPELVSDTTAMRALLREQDLDATVAGIRSWREHRDEALIILDQFEELFTLCPRSEQKEFTDLLSRLTFEADVHILISLRDDFLFHCQDYPCLAPLYESLTVLGPLTGAELRRALVQPARDCGYQFEDENLADEMMASVEGERGALPLPAFAMARLWEKRDREQGLITRAAYQDIGEVGGALAQHAESVMEQILSRRHGLVQELFRNLVTAQGTRTVQEREKLLSVFDEKDRSAAEEILGKLIDARLLTSYEFKTEDGGSQHRVEVVHESLLKAWPRLVRWRTQDEDSAQLRDQLRQAAQLWRQKDRSEDLLWTGTAYLEFSLWRERYPGGLNEEEAEFASAMEARNQRRKRQRRLAVSGAFLALFVVLIVVGYFGQEARRQARMSEALNLAIFAEEKLEEDNTLALALATESLRLKDDPEVRRLALNAIWQGPVRFTLQVPDTLHSKSSADLSPDGNWLAVANGEGVLLWPRDGNAPRSLAASPSEQSYQMAILKFDRSGQNLAGVSFPRERANRVAAGRQKMTLWSLADGREIGSWLAPTEGLLMPIFRERSPTLLGSFVGGETPKFSLLEFAEGSSEPIFRGESFELDSEDCHQLHRDDLVFCRGNDLYFCSLDSFWASHVNFGSHPAPIRRIAVSADNRYLASSDADGLVKIWRSEEEGLYQLESESRILNEPVWVTEFSANGQWLAFRTRDNSQIGLLSLQNPQGDPVLLTPFCWWPGWTSFTPEGSWAVFPECDDRFGACQDVHFYSLAGNRPSQAQIYPIDQEMSDFRFLANGRQLAARNLAGELWLADLDEPITSCRKIWKNPAGNFNTFESGPLGKCILHNGFNEMKAWLVPTDGSDAVMIGKTTGCLQGFAVNESHTLAAVSGTFAKLDMPDTCVIRVKDLESGEVTELWGEGGSGYGGLHFISDRELLSWGHFGMLLWDLKSGDYRRIREEDLGYGGSFDRENRFWLGWNLSGQEGQVCLIELATGKISPVALPQETNVTRLAPDASFLLTGVDEDGRVAFMALPDGPIRHLHGHRSPVKDIWIAPDGNSFKTVSGDGEVLIWKVPETRPTGARTYEEFLEMLLSQTNLRAKADPEAEEGYSIYHDKFPGWEKSPIW